MQHQPLIPARRSRNYKRSVGWEQNIFNPLFSPSVVSSDLVTGPRVGPFPKEDEFKEQPWYEDESGIPVSRSRDGFGKCQRPAGHFSFQTDLLH